jgi:formyltetrahydrofolate deformylase
VTAVVRQSDDSSAQSYVLVLSCPDVPGIVHAVSSFVLEHGCTIDESQQYGDPTSEQFFMRVQFRPAPGRPAVGLAVLHRGMARTARRFAMRWDLRDASHRARLLIMVSRYGHCLNDLLFRASTGWLAADIVAVVSNHSDLAWMAENHGVPFHHLPVTPDTKPAAEAHLMELVNDLGVDLVVLARYMQILSEDLCKELEGRAVNIHHSMLPSFKGARPYHQAHERGVKLVGATAHYVTSDLDEGPIIEQAVERVHHAMTPDAVVAQGWYAECYALARAVRWHIEHRVLLNSNRTIVFD